MQWGEIVLFYTSDALKDQQYYSELDVVDNTNLNLIKSEEKRGHTVSLNCFHVQYIHIQSALH